MKKIFRSFDVKSGSIPRKSNDAGFTLIELLVVLAIMGFLTLTSVVYATVMPSVRLRTAGSELVGELKELRGAAIEANLVTSLNGGEGGWRFVRPKREEPLVLPSGIALIYKAPSVIKGESYTGGLRFFPDGSATGGYLELSNGEDRLRLTIDWLTGRLEIGELQDAEG